MTGRDIVTTSFCTDRLPTFVNVVALASEMKYEFTFVDIEISNDDVSEVTGLVVNCINISHHYNDDKAARELIIAVMNGFNDGEHIDVDIPF